MLIENNNLKDSSTGLDLALKDTSFSISYTKTDKLITALYMVTDIMDRDEPLRNKLRTLGVEILSDIKLKPQYVYGYIGQLMSFLEVAFAVSIVSSMNYNVLYKEFTELKNSIKEFINKNELKIADKNIVNIGELFLEEIGPVPLPNSKEPQVNYYSIGHKNPTRIGVQKASSLMKALSDKTIGQHDREARPNMLGLASRSKDFEMLKKERRFHIVQIIKNSAGGATIKDIKDKAKEVPDQANSLTISSEKTLQRELVSMVQDGVLYKTGEKRWSRYFLKN